MSIRIYYLPGHREHPRVATTPAEVNAFIDDLLTQPYDLSAADLYPIEHNGEMVPQLSVGVDPERGVGGLQYLGPGGRWFSKGTPSTYPEVVYCHYGNEREYPHDSEIPIDSIRTAVTDFLESGGERPEDIAWQPAPVRGGS